MALRIKGWRGDVFWIDGSTRVTVESVGERKVVLLVENPNGATIEREDFIRKKNPSDPRLPENVKK